MNCIHCGHKASNHYDGNSFGGPDGCDALPRGECQCTGFWAGETPSGVKADTAKPDFTVMIDPNLATPTLIESFRGLRDVVAFGAAKYTQDGWLDVQPNERYLAACLRHLVAFQSGEVLDSESGLPHLDHALCSLLFFVEKTRRLPSFLNEVQNVTAATGQEANSDYRCREASEVDSGGTPEGDLGTPEDE